MPGKVNPTQCEALIMCCAQVFGNDVAINFGGSAGNFQLNVCKPLLIYNFLFSARLLADASASFLENLVTGLEPARARIAENLERSLMLVTALTPHIGYDRAAKIAKTAHEQGLSLRQAALSSGWVSESEFEAWVRVQDMVKIE
jgi:fumarate hydratase class II